MQRNATCRRVPMQLDRSHGVLMAVITLLLLDRYNTHPGDGSCSTEHDRNAMPRGQPAMHCPRPTPPVPKVLPCKWKRQVCTAWAGLLIDDHTCGRVYIRWQACACALSKRDRLGYRLSLYPFFLGMHCKKERKQNQFKPACSDVIRYACGVPVSKWAHGWWHGMPTRSYPRPPYVHVHWHHVHASHLHARHAYCTMTVYTIARVDRKRIACMSTEEEVSGLPALQRAGTKGSGLHVYSGTRQCWHGPSLAFNGTHAWGNIQSQDTLRGQWRSACRACSARARRLDHTGVRMMAI